MMPLDFACKTKKHLITRKLTCDFVILFLGTVKYVGVIDDNAIAPQLYVGVKLDDNGSSCKTSQFISVNSPHNGVFKGKRYFHCPRGHGAMVKYTEVKPLKPADPNPPINGNYMFPSWDEVRKRRKERNEKLTAIYLKAGVSPPPEMGSSGSLNTSQRKIHITDPHDVALRDLQRKEEKERKRIRTIETDRDKQEMRRLNQQFGGGPNAERMAQTLRKLQLAYQEGLNYSRRRTRDPDADMSDDASTL
ncbi:hypothetical protein KUTeg_020004 [Tegillarca granosa]|uniref:CAP-Gly domain-containing protein n=1 Tax=Tegillarca granosa TaxID=220873 RepID=A0ABQ9EE78_TEGGR|nr:hypothetical protein KUTeg_020004 [Tegillarca granosa]